MEDIAKQKERVEKAIVQATLAAAETGKITEQDMSEIGTYVLNGLEFITTEEELIDFLVRLGDKWEIFLNIGYIIAGEAKESEQKASVKDVEALMAQGKLDEALSLAKSLASM